MAQIPEQLNQVTSVNTQTTPTTRTTNVNVIVPLSAASSHSTSHGVNVNSQNSLYNGNNGVVRVVNFTVGKIDGGIGVLLTSDHHVLEVPAMILPESAKGGTILRVILETDPQAERKQISSFTAIQEEIFGRYSLMPKPPTLELYHVTQSFVWLKVGNPLPFGNCTLLDLDFLYHGGSVVNAAINGASNAASNGGSVVNASNVVNAGSNVNLSSNSNITTTGTTNSTSNNIANPKPISAGAISAATPPPIIASTPPPPQPLNSNPENKINNEKTRTASVSALNNINSNNNSNNNTATLTPEKIKYPMIVAKKINNFYPSENLENNNTFTSFNNNLNDKCVVSENGIYKVPLQFDPNSLLKFQVRMKTTGGLFVSNQINVTTRPNDDFSCLCFYLHVHESSSLDPEAADQLVKEIKSNLIGVKLTISENINHEDLSPDLHSHIISEGNASRLADRAAEYKIPILKKSWIHACIKEKCLVPIKGHELTTTITHPLTK